MAGVNNIVFGDSIPFGVGVSNVADSWPRLLAALLGVRVDVNAQPGENLQKLFGTNSLTNLLFEPTSEQLASQPVFEIWNPNEYNKLIVEAVINDARLNGQDQYNNISTFKAAYYRILNEFNRKGCPDSSIVLMNCGIDLTADQETNDRIAAFNAVYPVMKSERPGLQIIDLHTFMASLPEPKSQWFADGLHPNESLTPLIAQFMYNELTKIVTPTPHPELFVKHGRFTIN